MLSIDYIRLQRKIVLEVQQTEIEKLADSFKLAGFTLTESFKNSSNPWQTVLIFWAFYSPLKDQVQAYPFSSGTKSALPSMML